MPDQVAVAVEGRALRKAYGGGVVALDGVDLRVPQGGSVAVMGPSGSGKSTLLHLLGLLDRPDDGEVAVGGQASRGLGERERAALRRDRIGFVFQAFNLVPVLTVAENVALPATIAGRKPPGFDARVRTVLERVGLADEAGRLPRQLSGGQQQRVALARAIVGEPLVLLADEPTGNLDSRSGAEVLALLQEVRREHGTAVVMVTHDAKAAAVVGDEVVLLRDGAIAGRLELRGTADHRRHASVLRWLEAGEGEVAGEAELDLGPATPVRVRRRLGPDGRRAPLRARG